MRLAGLIVLLILALAGRAAAYPQFHMSRDQTCTGCHISPAGGNVLNENGLLVAESIAQLETAPEFFYNKIPHPDWLVLGGDMRSAGGYLKTPENALAWFPMQIELYAHATFADKFALHINLGPRPPTMGNENATRGWAREHYFMYQHSPGEPNGLYVRAGRFMPVIGLRLAEHPVYIRRYGGTQLYADTYGVAVEYVQQKYEFHATGFIKDPVIDPVEHHNGAAGYAEFRPTESLSLGVEGMAELGKHDKRFRGGITAKLYISAADLLVQGEFQFVNQLIEATATNPSGGAPQQFVGYLLFTRMLGKAFMLDVGLGHFDANRLVRENERDCADLNLHWFMDSHTEIIFNSRYEMIGLGKGGDPGGYALVQLHYRL